MIESIDGYLIGLDFDEEELKAISYRGYLYGGIALMGAVIFTFAALIAVG